ncbi:MAG: DinB family protein [Gemmatimonadota bacterium]
MRFDRKVRRFPWLALALAWALPAPAHAQSGPTDYRDEFLRHFEASSRKVTLLAEAMPERLYSWSPGEGVMSVARVYAHVARYNFLYLATSLGVAPPEEIELATVEDRMAERADKAEIRVLLDRSVTHVREQVSRLTEEELAGPTTLYGREVAGWTVLLQLLAHMNEHVGQSVAYARMNGVVPPWSM